MTALLTFKGANGLGDPGVEHLSSLELVGVDHEIGSSKQDGWWMSKPSHAICSFAPIHKPIVVQKLVCEGTIQIVQAISKVQKFARLELQIFNSDGIPSLQYTLFDAFIFEYSMKCDGPTSLESFSICYGICEVQWLVTGDSFSWDLNRNRETRPRVQEPDSQKD